MVSGLGIASAFITDRKNVSFYVGSLLFQSSSSILCQLPIRGLISFCDFQTNIGAAAYATSDTEKLISQNRSALPDTIAALEDSSGMSATSEMHEWLPKIMVFWTVLCLNRSVIWLIF